MVANGMENFTRPLPKNGLVKNMPTNFGRYSISLSHLVRIRNFVCSPGVSSDQVLSYCICQKIPKQTAHTPVADLSGDNGIEEEVEFSLNAPSSSESLFLPIKFIGSPSEPNASHSCGSCDTKVRQGSAA
jgi:hypothetical protein